jgi:NhaP-type Na+/H+ or K+/H+ antiporter
METGLILLLAMMVIYTMVASSLGRKSITMAIFFVVLGTIFGEQGLGFFRFSLSEKVVGLLIEITLGLLLFADASTLNLKEVREDTSLPARLLFGGMPLTIMFGACIAYLLFPSEDIGILLLIACILAPTDAALGLPIFNNPRVPVRIRRALNVESGLNDGIATPFVTLFIALSIQELEHGQGYFVVFALNQIVIGIAAGTVLGLLCGWLYKFVDSKGWTSNQARQIGNLTLALLIFFITRALGGNSFVAVFVAGILFGNITKHLLHEATEYTEVTGTLLSILVWTVFGSDLVIPLFKNFNPIALIYALLSLTIIRMIPVAIGLIGSHFRVDTKLMMGWLGPRGLASVVFLVMSHEAAQEVGINIDPLITTVSWTILLSVLLHGISGVPLANWYGNRMDKADPDTAELLDIPELQTVRRTPFSLPIIKTEN